MTTAVVTLAHGRHGHLTAQRESLLLGTRLPDLYVVVSIEDSWIDGWSRLVASLQSWWGCRGTGWACRWPPRATPGSTMRSRWGPRC